MSREKYKLDQIRKILLDPFPATIYPQLNELERKIAQMVVIDGMTAQEITEPLKTSIGTVNTSSRILSRAFGVKRGKWAKLVFDRIREALGGE